MFQIKTKKQNKKAKTKNKEEFSIVYKKRLQ